MNNQPQKDDYSLKPSDIAQRHNVGRQTVLNWIREGRLPALNFGVKKPSYRISRTGYETFLAARAIGHPPRARPLSNRAMLLLSLRLEGGTLAQMIEVLQERNAAPNERSLQEELRRMAGEELVDSIDGSYDLTSKGMGYSDTLHAFLEGFIDGNT